MTYPRPALWSLIAGLAAPPTIATAAPEGPHLAFPLACVIGRTCEVQNNVDHDPGAAWKDYRCGAHTYDTHTGVDFRLLDITAQRAGVNVLAAAGGKVIRLRDGVADSLLRGPVTPALSAQGCGNAVVVDNGEGWQTSYCHMAKGSVKVKVGDTIAAGQPIGQVGLSGLTAFPHLHLEVRRNGAVVDPFAPQLAQGACDAQGAAADGLWTHAAAQALTYKRGAVLNTGFTSAPIAGDAIEAGGLAPASPGGPLLIAYVRALNLEVGDVQDLILKDPTGVVISQSRVAALDHAKADYTVYIGRKRPAEGWRSGVYTATYSVTRGGAVAIKQTFSTRL